MRWAWKLGEVAGIGIYIHWTFIILPIWVIISARSAGMDAWKIAEQVALVCAVFGCIVLHELGHALMARHYHIRTRDITLLPIGGVARLERMPEDPRQELWVALAGPAVNVAIAACVAVVIGALWLLGGQASFDPRDGGLLEWLLTANLFLLAFNLLPAFPMDGGRVLRALLARRMSYVDATQRAASIGQIMAIGFGILGFFSGQFMLIFVALFVYVGAQEEAHLVQVRSVLKGVPVRDTMITRFATLRPDDTLATAIGALMSGTQQDFPVVEEARVVGVLPRGDIMRALAEGGRETLVRDAMRRDCTVVEDNAMLDDLFQRMQSDGCATVPVVRSGRLVGIVTLENLGEWLMVKSALRAPESGVTL